MKNKLSIFALSFFVFRASFIGITSHFLLNNSKQNSWITFLIGSILSFPIVLLYYYSSKKFKNLNINEYLKKNLPLSKKIINLLITLIIFFMISINFYNLVSLVSLQYLYKTPKLVTSLIMILPIYYLSRSTSNTFKNTIVLLFYINFFLIILAAIGLIPKINTANLYPLNEYNYFNNITYPICFNTIPLIMILIFPGQDITKEYIYGYVVATASIVISLFIMISLHGIDLLLLFKYPDFFVLKLAYDGFINIRLQNIFGIQYIIDLIVFISLGLKFSYRGTKKANLFSPLLLVLISYIINIYNIEIYNKIINIFKYVLLLLPITITFLLIKKEKTNFL